MVVAEAKPADLVEESPYVEEEEVDSEEIEYGDEASVFEALEAGTAKRAHGDEEAIVQAKEPMDYFISMNSKIS